MHIINLTANDVTITAGKEVVTYKKSGREARAHFYGDVVSMVGEVKLYKESVKRSLDLPSEKEDTLLIVSSFIRKTFPDRLDLITPRGVLRKGKRIYDGFIINTK